MYIIDIIEGGGQHPYLPSMVGSRRVGLIQIGRTIEIKAHDEGGNAKGPSSVTLRVTLHKIRT